MYRNGSVSESHFNDSISFMNAGIWNSFRPSIITIAIIYQPYATHNITGPVKTCHNFTGPRGKKCDRLIKSPTHPQTSLALHNDSLSNCYNHLGQILFMAKYWWGCLKCEQSVQVYRCRYSVKGRICRASLALAYLYS